MAKKKRAVLVDDVPALPPAEELPSAAVVEETALLVELTPEEVQRQIAIHMRDNVDRMYEFCPAGDRYHLNGCSVVTRNARSFALPPCPNCAVGHFDPIYEGQNPQLFWANTLPGSGTNHYHVDRFCVRSVSLQSKTMCLHCLDAQKMQMFIQRLKITTPFTEQTMRQNMGLPAASSGQNSQP